MNVPIRFFFLQPKVLYTTIESFNEIETIQQ